MKALICNYGRYKTVILPESENLLLAPSAVKAV
jgi:hypothetical protein